MDKGGRYFYGWEKSYSSYSKWMQEVFKAHNISLLYLLATTYISEQLINLILCTQSFYSMQMYM